jgi:hypothetical protein
MAVSYGGDFPSVLSNPNSQTIMAGDRLFVFNDGTTVPRGSDSTFSVYDDSGNLLIAPQRLTDATDEELQGWVYFGVPLPYVLDASFVELHDDGGFTIHYGGSNPIVQRDTPAANPNFVKTRRFDADGTPEASQPGGVGGQKGERSSIIQLDDGLIARAWLQESTRAGNLIRFEITSADQTVSVAFTPSGERLFGLVAAAPKSIALTTAGDNILLAYQDQQSGDVHARIFARTGQEVVPEFVIGGTDNAPWSRPAADSLDLLTLADGRIVVTYANQREGVDSDPELFHAILNPNGSLARAPAVVNDDVAGGSQYDGLLFALSDGGYAIVYHTIGGSPYRQEALVRQFDANGNPVGGSVAFEGDTPGQSLNAHHAAIFPNGFGYMLDGFGSEFTIRIDGQSAPVKPPPGRAVAGTEGPDSLEGGAGNDTLAGLGGNDTLRGMDGSDTLNGGDGDDIVFGGATAADLRDLIYGGAGNDLIDAGHGNDLVFAGDGNDTVDGGFGVDEVVGQGGDDVLTGGAFSDLIFGGDGSDFINGGFGSDRVNGGTGADRFYHLGIADHGSDWVQDFASAEGDRLVFGGAGVRSQFQVNFAQTQGAGAAGVDEAFVIYRPTGQILWALVDGAAQTSIEVQAGSQVFDLLA